MLMPRKSRQTRMVGHLLRTINPFRMALQILIHLLTLSFPPPLCFIHPIPSHIHPPCAPAWPSYIQFSKWNVLCSFTSQYLCTSCLLDLERPLLYLGFGKTFIHPSQFFSIGTFLRKSSKNWLLSEHLAYIAVNALAH